MSFEATIAGSQVTVADVKYGDTGKEVQLKLVEDVLASNPDIDALVGNAVMAEAATQVLGERGLADRIGVYTTYVTPELVELMGAGRANCGPSEQSSLIGRWQWTMPSACSRTCPLPVPSSDMRPFRWSSAARPKANWPTSTSST